MLERLHSTLRNILSTYHSDSLENISARITASMRSTYHRILGKPPAEVASNRNYFDRQLFSSISDAIEEAIRRKQEQSKKDLKLANSKRIATDFSNKKVLVEARPRTTGPAVWTGPFNVIETKPLQNIALVDRGPSSEWISYRRLKPFKEEEGVASMWHDPISLSDIDLIVESSRVIE